MYGRRIPDGARTDSSQVCFTVQRPLTDLGPWLPHSLSVSANLTPSYCSGINIQRSGDKNSVEMIVVLGLTTCCQRLIRKDGELEILVCLLHQTMLLA